MHKAEYFVMLDLLVRGAEVIKCYGHLRCEARCEVIVMHHLIVSQNEHCKPLKIFLIDALVSLTLATSLAHHVQWLATVFCFII